VSEADPHVYEVLSRTEQFASKVFRIVTDEVAMPGGRIARRDYMMHLGAVGVVAIEENAGREQIVLVRQYRHPVGRQLWELPAGLIDVDGEPLDRAALRELEEEADLTAARMEPFMDVHVSPGCSNERIRLFLARELSPVPAERRHERHDEEANMITRLVDLDEAVAMALRGEITNAACLVGVFAAARARDLGWPPPRLSGDVLTR
jgi:8-oxo-dGTP pyrophosphatase MutT (NUDIX family)